VCLTIGVCLASLRGDEYRSIDGFGNNLAHPEWGSIQTNFARMAPVDYADGISIPRVDGRPNIRGVGVALMRQIESRPSDRLLSGYVYAFGNFISHDMQATVVDPTERLDSRVPPGDDMFPDDIRIPIARSRFDAATGTGPGNPRQQVNFSTAFLDGSQVYGTFDELASALRGGPVNPGAKLLNSNALNNDMENLLPRDVTGPAPNNPFIAGDGRVNDNIPLTAMHTLFMREHNRLVDVFAAEHPDWSPEELYQRARKVVGAELQAITFNEFLPALMGPHAPAPSGTYDPEINPTINNEFPAVFLRIGHSMLTSHFQRVQNDGQPAPGGPLRIDEAIFAPWQLPTSAELDLFLKGLSVEVQEETDLRMVDGIRAGLLDAVDLQRARDHGLPDYNTMREAYGLPRVTSFAEITSDVSLQNAIAAVYPNINDIDPLVGALAEDYLPGASVGPLVAAGYRVQFDRLRDGDRFWYEHDPDFTADEVTALRSTTLADIILRNTGVANLQSSVFFVVPEPHTWLLILVAALFALANRSDRDNRLKHGP
jgi:hypothetical protein